MVQVDVFWAYGWGASLALAAGPQLTREEKPLEAKHFTATLLFLSLFWAPTGMLLLLRHPSWETMQVAPHFSAMSEWLILAFGITNITQGILGYWLTTKLLKAGITHAARLNWIIGYFGMFFILLYGWDGLGYDRFLYDRDMLPQSPAWSPGIATEAGPLTAFLAFFSSSVAKTLYLDGLWLLPPFIWLAARWRREASIYLNDQERLPSGRSLFWAHTFGIFGVGLGGAAFTAWVVRRVAYLLGVGEHVARAKGLIPANTALHLLSYLIGLPLGVALLWFLLLRPGRIGERWLRPLSLRQEV
jgi:hypothetical protein